MADNTETIATVAMQSSKAWPAVFHQGAALCLWRAAVAAIEAAGFSIVQGDALAAAHAENDKLRAALECIAEEHDAGRHDGLPEPCPAHDADTMFAIACAALAEKEPAK